MLFYCINSIFFNPELFLIKIYDILKNNILTCSLLASVESWLLWHYASRSSLLYSGFKYTIELPLQPYKIHLYTFRVQGLAFFLPWFPDYTFRYLDDILNNDNVYFDNIWSQIYHSELQLFKANTSDTEAAFIELHLSISNDIVSTKTCDRRDDFDFEIVNFPFLDGDVPRSTSYGVYISQLIHFARASSYITDFNTPNKLFTQKPLKQGYRYHKLPKTFSKFYRWYYDLISIFQDGFKSLLRQGPFEPDSTVTWCINWRRLLALIIFQRSSLK